MNLNQISLVVKTNLQFILSVGTISVSFLVLLGCQKSGEEKKDTKPTITIENVQTAYSKEMNHHKMYKAFIEQAKKDKMKNIARLYQTLARSEEIHALNHIKLLQTLGAEPKPPQDESVPIGTTMQTLKMALSMEEIEYGTMYANMFRCAEMEKQEEALKVFQHTQDADSKHAELLRYAIDKGKNMPALKYSICKMCGYILTTEQTDSCPTCKASLDNFEKM
ncbi:MAG: ferritin family protein [Bacteroidota bacterium]|nr:ferritin family protein [Bacteroidota bacterium]